MLIDSSDGVVNLPLGGQPLELASLELPAGRYLIDAKTNLIISGVATCSLRADGVEIERAQPNGLGSSIWVYPVFVAVVDEQSTTTLTLECLGERSGDNASQTRLVASPA